MHRVVSHPANTTAERTADVVTPYQLRPAAPSLVIVTLSPLITAFYTQYVTGLPFHRVTDDRKVVTFILGLHRSKPTLRADKKISHTHISNLKRVNYRVELV